MPGFSNEEAALAINTTLLVNKTLEIKDAILQDINQIREFIAEIEADGNTKTRVYAYMDLQEEEENKSEPFKAKLALVMELDKLLRNLGIKKAAKKRSKVSSKGAGK